MKKNILLFCDNFYPQVDGVAKVVYNYAHEFNKTDYCGVVVPNFHKPLGKHCDFDVFLKNNFNLRLPGTIAPINLADKKLTKILLDKKPDIIHCHSPFAIGHYGLKIAKKLGVPVVATFHSQFKYDLKEYVKSRLISWFVLRYIVRFFNKCDEVWAVSKPAAEMLKSYGFKKDIRIMTNGVDFEMPEDVDQVKKNAIEEFKIDTTKKNIVYVGQLRKAKNIKLIMDTLHEISKNRQDFHMFFAGNGVYERKMKKLAKKYKIAQNITLLGSIKSREKLTGLLLNSDVFFFPSTYDTFSLVVREACVCKLPVLLTKGSGASDGFIDGKNGFLADENVESMAEKLNFILDNPEKARKCGEISGKTIPFYWNQLIPGVSEAYDELIKNNKKTSKE